MRSYPALKERIRLLSPEASAKLSAEEKAKCIAWNFLDASVHRGYSVAKAERDLGNTFAVIFCLPPFALVFCAQVLKRLFRAGWKPTPMQEWYKETVAFFDGEEGEEYAAGDSLEDSSAPFNDDELMAKLDQLWSADNRAKI